MELDRPSEGREKLFFHQSVLIMWASNIVCFFSLCAFIYIRVSSGCTQVLVGKALVDVGEPALLLSDLEMLEHYDWSSVSCLNLTLELKEDESNLTRVDSLVKAIPKEKKHLTLVMRSKENFKVNHGFKCRGYTVDVVGLDGESLRLCSSSVKHMHINVTYFCFFPYCIPDYRFDDGTSPFLLKLILSKLNMVADKIFLAKGYDLRPNEKGEIIGLVGDVATGKADIGMGQPSLTVKRLRHIDYSVVISRHTFGFCSEKPTKLSALFAIIRPFNWQVWFTTLLLLIVIPALFYLQKRLHTGSINFAFSSFSFTFRVLLWGASVAHNGDHKNKKVSWILLTWLGVGMILSIAYSSKLLAEMVVLRQNQPFDTVDQMLKSDLQVFLLEGSIMGPLMKMSARPNMRELYHRGVIEQNGIVKNDEWQNNGMVKAQKEGRAVRVCTPPTAVFQDAHFSKELIASLASANIVPKGSSLKGPIDFITSQALAAGLMQKKFSDLVENRALTIQKEERTNGKATNSGDWEALSLHHFYGLVIFWMLGILAAVVSFLTTEIRAQAPGV